jgi:hypothetical protein
MQFDFQDGAYVNEKGVRIGSLSQLIQRYQARLLCLTQLLR